MRPRHAGRRGGQSWPPVRSRFLPSGGHLTDTLAVSSFVALFKPREQVRFRPHSEEGDPWKERRDTVDSVGLLRRWIVVASTALLDDILSSSDLSDLVSHRLIEAVPFVFAGDRAEYVEWKTSLAEKLMIDPYAMIIVGSAALGISLNPNKELAKPFSSDSDIDVAIISSRYFDEAWISLREMRSGFTFLSSRVRYAIKRHREGGLLFDGAIATDQFLQYLPFGPDWVKALSAMSRHPRTLHREVNARLYRDIDSLRRYQTRAFTEARQRLSEAPEKKDGET